MKGAVLTPPSRIRRGSMPHSSRTASSRAWNHGSHKLPSHQSAVRLMSTYAQIHLSISMSFIYFGIYAQAHTQRCARCKDFSLSLTFRWFVDAVRRKELSRWSLSESAIDPRS